MIIKRIFCTGMAGCLALSSAVVLAAGYKLEFQSVSIMGGSGEAAAVEDAGTNWYNPAGLVDLPRQAVFSAIDVYAPTKFTGTQTAYSAIIPNAGYDYTATGSAGSYPNSVLPAIHYNIPFKQRFAFGLSIVPAWGFKEDYGSGSMVRYEVIKIHTKTIDLAPSLAFKFNPQWSIGAGPDFHYFSVQRSSDVRTQPLTTNDSYQRFSADNWDMGWHAGILFHINDATRVGANYRSKIQMNMSGDSYFALYNIASLESSHFTLDVLLPPVTTVSVYHALTNKLAVLGTVNYEQWGKVKSYQTTNIIEPPPPGHTVNQDLVQNFKNTFDYSIGAHYKINEKVMLRGSVKYEPTPVDYHYRDIDFPDNEKTGFQIGSRYQVNKNVALDFVYGHVFVKKAPIDFTNPLTGVVTSGNNRTHVDLLGAQAVITI